MFQADEQIIDDRPKIPQSAPDQPPQGESNFGESSEPLFSFHSKNAERMLMASSFS
jgi:hypothetical protein